MLPARCSVPRLDAQVRTEATVEAESADRSPRGPLFNSVRLSARKVAQWELKLFFPQRTDGDMQQQLGLRNSKDRERFYAAFLGTLFLSLGGSLALAGSNLPEAVKTSSTLILAAGPFAFVGAGLLVPGGLLGSLSAIYRLNPEYRRRQLCHEAGHFLVGYLVGIPVDTYSVGGAEVAVRFEEAGLRSGGGRATSAADRLDVLACVSMAGIAGEVIGCGDAEGGADDLAQLRGIMVASALRAKEQQDDRVRWATLMALTQLQRHGASFDALVESFERGDDVPTCISAIERAAVDERHGTQPEAAATST